MNDFCNILFFILDLSEFIFLREIYLKLKTHFWSKKTKFQTIFNLDLKLNLTQIYDRYQKMKNQEITFNVRRITDFRLGFRPGLTTLLKDYKM